MLPPSGRRLGFESLPERHFMTIKLAHSSAAPRIIRPDTCRSCVHMTLLDKVLPGEPEGTCRGAPPQIVATAVPGPGGTVSLSVQTLFPRVQLEWHCGMWKTRLASGIN